MVLLYAPSVAEDGTTVHDGSVDGWRRVNTAGYPGSISRGSTFTGSYKFDDTGPYKSDLKTGVITVQADAIANHVWDYAFVMVSQEELQIAANARLPRPGAATGTMKRVFQAIGPPAGRR